MRSVAPMKIAKIGYIVISSILCVLGIMLTAAPELSVSVIGSICGVILIVFGIIRLIGFFSKDLYRLAFQYDLAFGIMMLILGNSMLLHPGNLMSFISITLGFSFLADGLFKIQIAIDSKAFGIQTWWLVLITAVITAIFGVILISRPSESRRILIRLTGLTMLCEGILNLSTMITAVKIIKYQKPDRIEAEYFEERED